MWGEGRPTRSTHRFTSLVLLFSTPTLSYFRVLQPYKQDLDNSDFLGKKTIWLLWPTLEAVKYGDLLEKDILISDKLTD